ncbi:outer membrane beta-barrel protein [Cesiribacter sp. SM1]|uniref:outer membrane beta-barrel protein n=1 Tax=Cesiribacter sp. SM1 TaxID=2861196 RepID=UPI001CD3A9D7|nr:outer membrane beta-barrel protein [Cesiribacter sp. SM1]
MKTLLLLLLLLLPLSLVQAQSPGRYAWAGISANHYRGDLEDGLFHLNPAIHAGLKFNRAKRLNGIFSIGYGSVSGQNPDFNPSVQPPIAPNKYFNTSFFTADYALQYNLVKTERFHLYISQGIGLFRYNPKDEQDRELQNLGTTRPSDEIYGNISLQLPTSLGTAFFLPNQWGLGLQASYLNPLTDYIDNIGRLGTDKGNDNVLQFRLMLLVPVEASRKGTSELK